jgi:hypothetical protein
MYDVSSKFNTFYREHVVLPREEKERLYELSRINIDRLKKGLEEYNEENNTNYKIVDTVVQGSVAMSTVIQSESKDYDIDVAIIFDKENIPEGTRAVKNIVVEALKKKCKQFNTEPEAKTNCVRIVYAEGYHVDFAIYRRFKDDNGNYQYEHCGSQWRPRDPRAIKQWFNKENEKNKGQLRKVVRLLKMFCKSREDWRMPGGLVQTVLVSENFQYFERIDQMFYETLKAIRNRLEENKEVKNPTDEEQSLLLVSKDDEKINNLYNRLTTYLNKLDILFDENCTEKQALEAWGEFFNHDYWKELLSESAMAKSYSYQEYIDYDETEEYIEDYYPVDIQYHLTIDCRVKWEYWRVELLSDILKRNESLKLNKELEFFIKGTNVPKPYQIYWKVKNRGEEAIKRNCIRGQILKTNSEIHQERTDFRGNHYVECYLVKDGVCVAKDRIDVPILL